MEAGWLRLQFRVDASYFDELASLLEACLALSVSIENDGDDEFFEVAFPGKPTWKKIRVSALFHDTVDSQAIIDFVNSTLFSHNPVPAIVERLQDQDWERVWLDQYQPIHVAYDLWVVPSWLEPPKPTAKNLRIDPGLAFGTGTHATTFLCLEWMAGQDLSDKRVLDYGAGSGILAIASLLQGATNAVAIDIDPLAVTAARENAERNDVCNQFVSMNNKAFAESEYCEQQYSLVIANILAEVLIENAKLLLDATHNNGQLLLSGILVSQRESIEAAFSQVANCIFSAKEHEGWLLIVVEKDI